MADFIAAILFLTELSNPGLILTIAVSCYVPVLALMALAAYQRIR